MLSVLRSTVVHYAWTLGRSGARQGHISHVQALKGVSLQDLMFTTTCSSDNRQGGTNIQPLPSPRGPLFPLSVALIPAVGCFLVSKHRVILELLRGEQKVWADFERWHWDSEMGCGETTVRMDYYTFPIPWWNWGKSGRCRLNHPMWGFRLKPKSRLSWENASFWH